MRTALFLLFLLALVGGPAGAQTAERAGGEPGTESGERDPLAGLDARLRDRLPELVARMREGLTRTRPNSSRWYAEAGGELFIGSYDWHSNVIAHWSLLTIARLTEDEDLAQEVAARLDGDALFAERALLAELDHDRRLTFPYDHAWLLMLLRELDHHAPLADLGGIDEFRLECEARVLDWLERTELPDMPSRGERPARYCGFYRSWLFAFLLTSWSEPLEDGSRTRLHALREERLDPHRNAILAQQDIHPFDFLYVPAVLALIERTLPGAEEPSLYPLQEFPALPDSVKLSDVHVVGTEISRIWPYALDSRQDAPGTRAAFQSRMEEILERTDLWSDDFTVVSHWVPQYVWITFWLALGRP